MDHSKIVASAIGMSIVLALVILGTGNAAAVGSRTNQWANPLASAVGSGEGSSGQNQQSVKPPIQPNGSVSAKPNITITLGAWRNMRPTESTLQEVSFLPASYSIDCQTKGQKSLGWIVGDGSTMLGYCNGIWDHNIVPLSKPENLRGVQAISPTLAVAVGDDGTILLYLYDLSANDWVWTKYPMEAGSIRQNSVSMAKQGDGSYTGWSVGFGDAAYGGKGVLVRGTISAPAPTGGITLTHTSEWVNMTNDYALPAVFSYFSVHTLAANNAWAVGGVGTNSNGIIIHWNGSQWTVFQNVAEPLYAVRMKSASEGWAVGLNGATYRFNGSTWSKVPSPSKEILHGIDYGPNGEVWAVGHNNTLMQYSGGGWQQVPTLYSDAFDFRGVDFTSGHGWVVGGHLSRGIGGQILEYENGLWLPVTMPTDNRLNAVATVSDTDAWAVGAPDESGGTIVHWDGRHWLRWFQRDLPIPAVELTTIAMASATDGWAAGDLTSDGKAVLLHWDGQRWAQPRYASPLNSRINSLDVYSTGNTSYPVFAWAVAEDGNAFAKYQSNPDLWTGLHSCNFVYYQTRGVSIIPGPYLPGNWDAWAVGKQRNNFPPYNPIKAGFMKFQACASDNAWNWKQDAPYVSGPNAVQLYGIKMMPGPWGYAGGNEGSRATIYTYNSSTGLWELYWIRPPDDGLNPSNFYSVGILSDSEVAWLGGYYTNPDMGNRKWAYINYIDSSGRHWVNAAKIIPTYGINVYHRPVRSVQMGSDTMGWAVGDPEDTSTGGGKSVVYQYPFPNFTLNTHPPARAVLPTGSTTFTVTVNSLGAFNADVSLSFANPLPANVLATINPPTIKSNQVATVSVTTSGATVGTYCLMVRGASTFTSGDVLLTVTRDACLNLYVTRVPVNGVSPDHGRYGTVVTISGSNFGSDPGANNRSTATNHVSWENVQMPNSAVQSWSNTQIRFMPPDSPSSFTDFPLVGRVKVTAGGFDSNDNYTFRMDPWISNLSVVAGAGVQTVSATGTSFGNDPGVLNRKTQYEHVEVDGVEIASSNVTSWSNNLVVFTVPLTSMGGMVTVTSNGFESNAVGFGSAANREYLPLLRR